MTSPSYEQRRGQLKTYFDRTAVDAWSRLTSDAPVGRIRATVRAGRDGMRATLLDWLGDDLAGKRILDAGCGTGALAVAAARRGAHVTAIDLSPTLVGLARDRSADETLPGSVDFMVGDMLDAAHGEFDYVVAMDSLIHYRTADVVNAVSRVSQRVRGAMLFTFAPRTAMLSAMHFVGRAFPRGDRAPSIEPVGERALQKALANSTALRDWRVARTHRVATGFYISQALELKRT